MRPALVLAAVLLAGSLHATDGVLSGSPVKSSSWAVGRFTIRRRLVFIAKGRVWFPRFFLLSMSPIGRNQS